jgi:hypothetical protein
MGCELSPSRRLYHTSFDDSDLPAGLLPPKDSMSLWRIAQNWTYSARKTENIRIWPSNALLCPFALLTGASPNCFDPGEPVHMVVAKASLNALLRLDDRVDKDSMKNFPLTAKLAS